MRRSAVKYSCFKFSAPKLIIGSIYNNLREKMKLLWNRDLKMNTVHVLDVARAIWHLYFHGKTREIYNLADKSDTSKYTGSGLQRVWLQRADKLVPCH